MKPRLFIVSPGPRNEHLYPYPTDKGVWVKKNSTAGATLFNLRRCEPLLFYGNVNKKRAFDLFEYSSGFSGELKDAQKSAGVSLERPPAKSMNLWIELLSMIGTDIVVDVFGGNGTTLIASEISNRKCYMMEIDPKYCDVIRQRYEAYINQKQE